MAESRKLICAVLSLLSFAGYVRAGDDATSADSPDPDALRAYREYWSAFDQYERHTLREGKKEFQERWEKVKDSYAQEQIKNRKDQLSDLEQAAENYKKHLEQLPQAENRPFVMLNYAQVLNLWGDALERDGNAADGQFKRNEAVAVLNDLDKSYPDFERSEAALYLRATILEAIGRLEDSETAWQQLAARAQKSIYGVHALVAVGDHFFKKDNIKSALAEYQQALVLVKSIEVPSRDFETLRVQYRLAWTAFRAAEYPVAVAAASALLLPGRQTKSNETAKLISRDATELVASALFEWDNSKIIDEALRRHELAASAGAIAKGLIERYSGAGLHEKAAHIGELAFKTVPTAVESPDILEMTAIAFERLNRQIPRTNAMERLAQLLPQQSLWRARNANNAEAVKRMEGKAMTAAEWLAASYYERGMSSGNVAFFATAASYYEILLDRSPNDDKAAKWRLRQGHSYYFADKLEDARRNYQMIVNEMKVPDDILQIGAYQLALTAEKQWRAAFAKALDSGKDPKKEAKTVAQLQALEKSIEDFANRFPDQSRAIDLLLVSANAHREHENYEQASKYWQRVLVAKANPAQKSVAIRGVVFAQIKTSSPGEVVLTCERFLNLEDWKALGQPLRLELLGILSQSTMDEAQRLMRAGQIAEAAGLEVKIAQGYRDVPNREKIYRDGAYAFALAGEWASAQDGARKFLDEGLKRYADDMTYLLARSQEYQIRLADAAGSYLLLGKRFPAHSQAENSLERAEKLALADERFDKAGQAAEALGDQARQPDKKMAAYARATDDYLSGKQFQPALRAANKRLRAAKSEGDVLRAQLQLSQVQFASGSEAEALKSFDQIGKRAERSREKLSDEAYADIIGQSQLRLGDEEKRRFEDFNIFERKGNLGDNVATKAKMFEGMAKLYDRAASARSPEFSVEARYKLAEAAEHFADEIASIPGRTNESLNFKTKEKYEQNVSRLRAMAKTYLSNNVLARSREPSTFKNNEWVQKSARKLASSGAGVENVRHDDGVPTAVSFDMPYSWSL